MLGFIIAFSLLGSVGALAGAGIILAFPNMHARLKTPLLAFAVGSLLGGAFIGLLPRAIELGNVHGVLLTTLAGFLAFFILEKMLHLPHVHAHVGEHPIHPAGTLILIGDSFHNFVDGVVIAASFLTSIPLGIIASLAVIAHEIPQELGDFVILLHSGWEKKRAYWANFAASLTTIPGALVAFAARDLIQPYLPFILAISASSFLYIAMADITPILHHEVEPRKTVLQVIGILAGIAVLFLIHRLFG